MDFTELLETTSKIRDQLNTEGNWLRYCNKSGWALSTKKDFWKSIDQLRLNYAKVRREAWDASRLMDSRQYVYFVTSIDWTSTDTKLFWNWTECKKYAQELLPDVAITKYGTYASPGITVKIYQQLA